MDPKEHFGGLCAIYFLIIEPVVGRVVSLYPNCRFEGPLMD